MEEEVMLRDLFCKAAQSGNGALLCTLKEDYRVDPMTVREKKDPTNERTAMDLVLTKVKQNTVRHRASNPSLLVPPSHFRIVGGGGDPTTDSVW